MSGKQQNDGGKPVAGTRPAETTPGRISLANEKNVRPPARPPRPGPVRK